MHSTAKTRAVLLAAVSVASLGFAGAASAQATASAPTGQTTNAQPADQASSPTNSVVGELAWSAG